MSAPILVIAEAGVNHNGERDLAFQLVDAAVAAGADCVKFQTFKTENVATRSAHKAAYQQQTTDAAESQYAMLKRLELPHQTHRELIEYCKRRAIRFLSTPFDLESLDFLVNDLRLETLKIPSGELTNGPLLLACARSGRELILSTGMATLGEIEEALGVFAFGMTEADEPPSRAAFQRAYLAERGRDALRERVTLLHCTTEYPAPFDALNLRAMETLRAAFGLRVGYSDHSEGIVAPLAAAALGASVIEKHFTLDRNLPGPDHKASLEPGQLKAMVAGLRAVEQALGDGRKGAQRCEWANRDMARKSLVARRTIRAGERFTEENLAVKRPGAGRSPMAYWALLGETSARDYRVDEAVD